MLQKLAFRSVKWNKTKLPNTFNRVGDFTDVAVLSSWKIVPCKSQGSSIKEKPFNVNKHGHCHMKTKETFLSLKFIQKNKNIKDDTFEAIFLSF